MAVNSSKKQSWWATLPGILTAITAFITAITGLVVGLNQAGLFGTHASSTTTSASTAPAAPINSREPPIEVPFIGLPAIGAEWQGFPAPSYAHCNGGDPAVVIAETTRPRLVICRIGPNDFYYKGAANNNDGGGIQLPAVHSSGGFDVTNSDGTTYHIRPDTMTISTPGKAPWSEPMLQYASSS